MKLNRIVFLAALTILSFCSFDCFPASRPAQPSTAATESINTFLGRWDLTLKSSDREYPSWLELRQESSELKADMVGRSGNVRPLPKVELSNGRLTFVSPKEEESAQADLVFQGSLHGQVLSGTLNGPDGKTWQWVGRRAPSLKRNRISKWGQPIQLFNGRDLSGWHIDPPKTSPTWKVENSTLISPGNGPELINDSKFDDFKLHLEFNCGENSNSGVYLRGRYEVQIETDSIEEPPSHHMGGVYGFIAPSPELARAPGKWQSYDITFVGRTITLIQNGQTVIDNREIPGITGGALDSNEGLPGPIYLQGSEKGFVAYRNVVLTPAEESK